jgi:hypothetical protein
MQGLEWEMRCQEEGDDDDDGEGEDGVVVVVEERRVCSGIRRRGSDEILRAAALEMPTSLEILAVID